jgi:hypothetical protein
VAGHDLAARAVGETAAEVAVEGLEPPDEGRRRVRAPERGGDRAGDLRVADRIEPDVRVAALCAVDRPDGVDDVERRPVAIADGVLDGGLEAAAGVDDERSVP